MQVRLEQPESLPLLVLRPLSQRGLPLKGSVPTRSAPFTDSSHRSIRNSSRAIESLSMLMRRWHSLRAMSYVYVRGLQKRAATHCGRKNSRSS